jgi:hypothetical protein
MIGFLLFGVGVVFFFMNFDDKEVLKTLQPTDEEILKSRGFGELKCQYCGGTEWELKRQTPTGTGSLIFTLTRPFFSFFTSHALAGIARAKWRYCKKCGKRER